MFLKLLEYLFALVCPIKFTRSFLGIEEWQAFFHGSGNESA